MDCCVIYSSRYQQHESAVMNDRTPQCAFNSIARFELACTTQRVLPCCHGVGMKGRLDHAASGPSKPKPAAKKPRHGPQGLECALDVVTRHAKSQDGRPVEVPVPTPPAPSVLTRRTVTVP